MALNAVEKFQTLRQLLGLNDGDEWLPLTEPIR
jgi:hypothetical protein